MGDTEMTDKKKKPAGIQQYPNPDVFPAGLAVFEFGDTAGLQYYNSALPGIFGYSPEDFAEKAKAGEILCLYMKNAVNRAPLEAAADSGEVLENTYVVERANSSAMWIFTSTKVKREGEKLICSSLIYDVTLQKSLIRQLDAEREKNALLQSQLKAITFNYDPVADYMEIQLDKAALKFSRFRELFPQTEHIHKDDRAQFYWWLSLKDKERRQTLSFRADFDGTGYKRYDGVLSVICDKYGTPYHCTGILKAE